MLCDTLFKREWRAIFKIKGNKIGDKNRIEKNIEGNSSVGRKREITDLTKSLISLLKKTLHMHVNLLIP